MIGSEPASTKILDVLRDLLLKLTLCSTER